MKKTTVFLDVDDTIADCIQSAVDQYAKDTGIHVDPNRVFGWAGEESGWTRYFSDPEFVKNQPVIPGAQAFVRELFKRGCDVIILTAVPMNVVPERFNWIRKNFPMIDPHNIIIGKRKDVCEADILIDDGAHNILKSKVKYPILMRRPWNKDVTGVLAVNGYDDCLNMIDTILRQNGRFFEKKTHEVTCLIGPSGSGKGEVAAALMNEGYVVPRIYTTSKKSEDYYRHMSRDTFEKNLKDGVFAETTSYGGEYYGIRCDELEALLGKNKKLVIPTDICGANALTRMYENRVTTVYLKRNMGALVSGILDKDIPKEEKVIRILALNNEERNEELCDFTVEMTTASEVVAKIMNL